MPLKQLFVVLCLSMLGSIAATSADGRVGTAVCAQCHRAIAATQAKTRMARTWQGAGTALLKPDYREEQTEGTSPKIGYRAARSGGNKLVFEAMLPGADPVSAPVEDVVGGDRHGVSFLVRLHSIGGAKLLRAPLIETRFLHSTRENALVLSPGFPSERPVSYETALGRPLSPSFEKKCLDCHGQPATSGSGGGIACEDCHGAGRAHLQAVAAGHPHEGITNPAKSEGGRAMQACSQCHSGFAVVSDPIPDDLLISNQVTALKNSECFIQSAGGIRCINCHDPHEDSPRVASKSVQTCLGCHSARVQRHAALCPVNRETGCTGCHMPEATKGSFRMVDHWIRVHPEQGVGAPAQRSAEWRSRVRPTREFLRIIVTDDAGKAAQARERLLKNDSFFDVARELSTDPSAMGGGFLGEMRLDAMDKQLADAAAALAPGELTPVIDSGTRHIILERLPRDFRDQAAELYRQASALRTQGKMEAASEKCDLALRIYPQFLRALIFLGSVYGQNGNAQRAAGILEYAVRLYPNDASAEYNLALAYEALGRAADAVAAYRRALEVEPDLVPAYENLGAALYAQGQPENAIEMYRQGLQVNPLAAVLYYNIGTIRREQGDNAQAKQWIEVARKIDPEFVAKQEGAR